MEKRIVYGIVLFFLALAIPGLLFLDSVQGKRFARLENEVTSLETKQVELIEDNRKLITGISVLSSSDRIERMADELGMRKATSGEIVRIQMKQ
jgi:cell division protein FtsL